ncbi:hypothetical protein MM221_10480 [Salipaludibacillus sp. LMS25]|uniref:hypothetical protein n=1 Tax=Salipaludibacillus sp. LMS25 TaxID=2924031 RepID=UPI0020D126CA|nr:hypothetical protein [Salipaludibacillus sp. LMS25]UTR16894.1 hypothetical protein MM221_10480 [Salipaludibacillus sp. LMS25]
MYPSLGKNIINMMLVDDQAYLEENALELLNYPDSFEKTLHVEFIEDDYALVFYEWGHILSYNMFGMAEMEKNLFSWELITAYSEYRPENYSIEWLIVELDDYTVMRGRIADEDIDKVMLNMAGEAYEVDHFGNGSNYWFYIGEKEDYTGASLQGISVSGEVIEEIAFSEATVQ